MECLCELKAFGNFKRAEDIIDWGSDEKQERVEVCLRDMVEINRQLLEAPLQKIHRFRNKKLFYPLLQRRNQNALEFAWP